MSLVNNLSFLPPTHSDLQPFLKKRTHTENTYMHTCMHACNQNQATKDFFLFQGKEEKEESSG